MTPLETFFRTLQIGSIAEVQDQLQKLSIDVNARDEFGNTALHSAASYRDDGVAQILLEKGADVNAKDMAGWTPLMTAANHENNLTLRQLLESNSSDINHRNASGVTALLLATKPRTQEKLTPNIEGVRVLLEHGAFRYIRDANGATAQETAYRQLASEHNHQQYQEVLKVFEEVPTATKAGAYQGNNRRLSIPHNKESAQHRALKNLTALSTARQSNPFGGPELDIFELSKPPGNLQPQEHNKLSSTFKKADKDFQWLHLKSNNVSIRKAS